MLILSKLGFEFLARWGHIVAGVTWIGLLYYFNFVQGPFVNKDASAETKSDVTRFLAPRALWWFRWAAALTFLTGVVMLGLLPETRAGGDMEWWFGSSEGNIILTGALLATIMFTNVWMFIWPNQKIVIANAEATAAGQPANPDAPKSARRAFIMSRTNTLLSVPMLFFMAAAAHLQFGVETGGTRAVYWLVVVVVSAAIEFNAITATDGPTTKYFEKHRDTIIGGFVLTAIFYALIELLLVAFRP